MPKTTDKIKPIISTGRRKTAVARVFMYEKKGDFTVNGISIDEYFKGELSQLAWMKPFHLVGLAHPTANYSASIKVVGSGKPSQLDAVVLGFSKILANMNDEYQDILRKSGLLTRDPRMVERKKPYLRKARKAPQFSKR